VSAQEDPGRRLLLNIHNRPAMTSKQLSNGTLSLKFMQNAQRSKDASTAQLERAEVASDGQWEIPRAIRDSWEINATSSCVPFIYVCTNLFKLFTEAK
jgi:hypothetical protein